MLKYVQIFRLEFTRLLCIHNWSLNLKTVVSLYDLGESQWQRDLFLQTLSSLHEETYENVCTLCS